MPENADGSLRPYTESEIANFRLRTRGVRDGSGVVETYAPDGSGCERLWWCNWDNRFDVVTHLMGAAKKYTDSGTPKISRLLPQSHPTETSWICTKAIIRGYKFLADDSTGLGTTTNKIPKWQNAEIEATYEGVPFNLLDDAEIESESERYVTQPGYPDAEGEPFSEYVGLPGSILRYQTPDESPPHGQPIPYNVGFTQGGEKIQAIWRRVPDTEFIAGSNLFTRVNGDPLAGVLPWKGTVNSAPLFGYPALTLLLESAIGRRRPDPTADRKYSWDIRYVWVYKPQGHFHFKFFDPKDAPTIANNWYSAKRGDAAYIDPEDFGDDDSLHPLRDHADGLFKISA